jgi:hypothetical protein
VDRIAMPPDRFEDITGDIIASYPRTHSIALADATTILLAAPAMSFKLTMGMSHF